MLGSLLMVDACSDTDREDGELVPETEEPPVEDLVLGILGFRFLVWMLSFFMAKGLGTPCSFMYSPHALQTGSPSAFRLHRVVVLVWQLVQQRPARLEVVCRRFCGLIRGRLIPFILWYRPQALHR